MRSSTPDLAKSRHRPESVPETAAKARARKSLVRARRVRWSGKGEGSGTGLEEGDDGGEQSAESGSWMARSLWRKCSVMWL